MTKLPPSTEDLRRIVDDISVEMATETERGRVATYIPELAGADPGRFGLAVVLGDGTVIEGGDSALPFSIQSVSKVFTLSVALGLEGENLWTRVGREPSGDPFNSIVQLEHERGIPRNPFINAGAIAVTDSILSHFGVEDALEHILSFIRNAADAESIQIDPAVARSEAETGFRNTALANFMRGFGTVKSLPAKPLGVYFNHCAIEMSVRQLAAAGRYLAFDGCLSPGGERIMEPLMVRQINALMLTCGHYDGSGEFAFRVGLPGKSGVGGGILAIAPGKASIGCWSPGLNKVGNSRLASLALERLAERTGWSVFAG